MWRAVKFQYQRTDVKFARITASILSAQMLNDLTNILYNFVGDIYLMTKGAEAAILSRCVKGDVEITEKHVIQYALVSSFV